jgi:two-component system KDP operon response regulator KdpE
MTRILVVDDEAQLARALVINLRANGYEADAAPDGRSALRLAADQHPDAIILDLGLPDMTGIDVLHGIRGWSHMPVVILSARDDEDGKVAALDAGADDYVTKPFSLDELLARVRAVTRRHNEPETLAALRVGRYDVDLQSHTILAADEPAESLHLTPIEWQLLEALVRNPGKLIGQRQLLQEVWGPSYLNETHYLRQYMTHLRRKLEDDPARPKHLITEPGMGYRFQP